MPVATGDAHCLGDGPRGHQRGGVISTWPLVLVLISRAALTQIAVLMMSIAFFNVALSGFLAVWVSQYYERMGNTNFWAMCAGLAILNTILFASLARPLNRAFATIAAPA